MPNLNKTTVLTAVGVAIGGVLFSAVLAKPLGDLVAKV